MPGSDVEVIKTDYVVVGSGVAGLRAAIELSSDGEVIVITKDIPTESSTEYAQGGVAVALSDEDEVRIHYEDTLKAGDGLCREEAVKVLVSEGPERIQELIAWGAEFDREGSKLAFTLEAAHSRRRILHAHGDATGREIERVLLNKVRSLGNVKKLSRTMTVDLIVKDNLCIGVLLIKAQKWLVVLAKSTILATGGAGQLYLRTTNPPVCTADGMAMALRAGAILEDMEFIQFHPTALAIKKWPQFLISEAMRGEGGILKNSLGERFMRRYHPDGELAPRDVVSRAIWQEMERTGSDHVFLDVSHLDEGFIKKRFPRIYETCLRFGIDITREPVPVAPAAHFIMGGIKTDIEGRTTLKGLYAAGEVACTGVHGANRLASNSLLEGLVFGYRAAKTVISDANPSPHEFTPELPRISHPVDAIGKTFELKKTMWQNAGIIRTEESLLKCREFFTGLKDIMQSTFMDRELLELRNLALVGSAVTESAIERTCSIGAHYRQDYPERQSCLYHQEVLMKDGKILVRRQE